jgi:bifunctional DNA-binding transcriptional regulator/antitoxin component of YhaV-PrlF toxin-antitoxin module
MPLASPPGRPDAVYGFGRIDASGRVADRAAIAALGWRGGDRLILTAEAGVMVARRDPGGMVTVPSRAYVVIPAALRRRCGLRAGDHVLLAASPDQDTLAAYSCAVVDQVLQCVGGGSGVDVDLRKLRYFAAVGRPVAPRCASGTRQANVTH